MAVEDEERYWLLTRDPNVGVNYEQTVLLRCMYLPIPIEGETVSALEVFTSIERADAEMKSLGPAESDAQLRAVAQWGAAGIDPAHGNTEPIRVIGFSRTELADHIEATGVGYVVIDPPRFVASEEDVTEQLRPAPKFVEELRE